MPARGGSGAGPFNAPLRRLFVSFIVALIPLGWMGWENWTLINKTAVHDEKSVVQELRRQTRPLLADLGRVGNRKIQSLVGQLDAPRGTPRDRLRALSRDPGVQAAFILQQGKAGPLALAWRGQETDLGDLPEGVRADLSQVVPQLATWVRSSGSHVGSIGSWGGQRGDGRPFEAIGFRANDRTVYGVVLDDEWMIRRLADPAFAASHLTKAVRMVARGRLPHGDRVLFTQDQMPRYWNFARIDVTPFAIAEARHEAREGRLSAEVWFVALMFWVLAAFSQLYRTARADLALAEMRSNFVSAVSHELKTPLGMIRMYAEMLQLGLIGEGKSQADYLGVIVNESDRLARLIDNVLDFSKIQKGTKAYRFETLDLREIVAATLRQMEPVFDSAGVAATFDSPAQPVWVRADRDSAYQALLNLLSNAVKYGGNQVTVTVDRDGKTGSLSVTDGGQGIPAAEQKKVFEPFYRMGKEEERTSQGTGLGLALVAEIMKAHGGEVRLDSASGRGARFTLVFPVAAEPAEATTNSAMPTSGEPRR